MLVQNRRESGGEANLCSDHCVIHVLTQYAGRDKSHALNILWMVTLVKESPSIYSAGQFFS